MSFAQKSDYKFWQMGLWLFLLTLIILLVFNPLMAKAEWQGQSCSFPHRIPVTITADPGGHNVETRIDLVSSDFPASYAFSPAGNDVRIFASDDMTPVDFVIAGWDDIARMATIYIRETIVGGASETFYIYFGDNSLGSGNNAAIVFPDIGVRLRSRVSTADPVSAADGLASFEAASVDVDDSIRTSITGLNNQALGGANGDFGWCVSAVLNVTAATAGTWEFRYGGDFGRGGHLYVRGQAVEEAWNDDLWWAGNYANTGETLEGSIALPEGWHRYEALGFEGCCDGGVGFQARAPGGAWQELSSSNFALRGAQCIVTTASVTPSASESCSTDLDASKTVVIDASSPSAFAIPGAIVRYDLDINNPGQIIDAASLSLTDVFPADVSLIVTGAGAFSFTDGAFPSGLNFSYGGPTDMSDSVEFSTDGSNFTYVPMAPSDDNVTHIRFSPTGAFNPNDSGDIPSFTIGILGEVK